MQRITAAWIRCVSTADHPPMDPANRRHAFASATMGGSDRTITRSRRSSSMSAAGAMRAPLPHCRVFATEINNARRVRAGVPSALMTYSPAW